MEWSCSGTTVSTTTRWFVSVQAINWMKNSTSGRTVLTPIISVLVRNFHSFIIFYCFSTDLVFLRFIFQRTLNEYLRRRDFWWKNAITSTETPSITNSTYACPEFSFKQNSKIRKMERVPRPICHCFHQRRNSGWNFHEKNLGLWKSINQSINQPIYRLIDFLMFYFLTVIKTFEKKPKVKG